MSPQFSVQMPSRVNGRNLQRGLSIVRRAQQETGSHDPDAIARAIERITDAEMARVRRSPRRVWQRIQHDEILRGLFGGLTGWAVAVWLFLMAWTLLVFVGVL